MKCKSCLLLVFVLSAVALTVRAQDPPAGAGARGVKPVERFVQTRPQPTPTPQPTNSSGPRRSRSKERQPVGHIGLGLTIYRQAPNDEWISTAPTHAFRTGDRVRFLIETNTAGYLYLFNATDRGAPVMIFPAGDLHNGENVVKAHVPYEIPNREAKLPWLEFKDPAAAERIYLLFARRPLSGVLRRQALVAYCQSRRQREEECVWEPSAAEWTQITARAEAEWTGTEDATLGQVQPAPSRSLRHPSNAPAPTLVKMRASPKAQKVLMSLELTHK